MSVKIYFSNAIESLAEAFAGRIAPDCGRFDPPTVIIPNPYLKKWLQIETARSNGIAMNMDFQFLGEGLWKTASRICPVRGRPVMMEQADVQILLCIALAGLDAGDRRVRPLADYLFGPDGSRRADYEKKAWQLASRLARYFLEYELYREDMIALWTQGRLLYDTDMEAAQQRLYLAVFGKNGLRDAVNGDLLTLPQYWRAASRGVRNPPRVPLHLFGKTQLSPFHVRMIYELGRYCDITIYQMNPCAEFWEDVTTPGEDRWERVRSIRVETLLEGEELAEDENENPLLKQWGKTGRETVKLLSLLEEAGGEGIGFTSEWILPARGERPATCLRTVQDQVLARTTRAGSSGRLSQDETIQVASCPDMFREAEAVYQSILHNLDRDAGLKMSDIAVMVPDMEAYGPVIGAVFSQNPKRLSFSLIDSTAASDSLAARALSALLEIASGSFTRSAVFELASNPCFLAAWSMTAEDADTWLAWADGLNIFRGFHKAGGVDPALNLHTWEQGLQRLRLGRIMRTGEMQARRGAFLEYRNIVPYADMNTSDRRCIDAFGAAVELLHLRTKDLALLRAPGAEWAAIVERLMSEFVAAPADRPEEGRVLRSLRQGLEKLALLDRPGADAGLSLVFVREFIAENMAGIPSNRGGYLTSGVNVSALVPKRQIPFTIIYLMGMQEGLFPGANDSSTLNLMRIKRRIGDVTRTDVNRYLFLETLLGCRGRLYLTYVSKDLKKDQDFYPNSAVGQLITYLENHVLKEKFETVEVPSSGSSERYLAPDGRERYSDFIRSCEGGRPRPVNYSEAERLLLLDKAAKKHDLAPAVLREIEEKMKSRLPEFPAPQRAAPEVRQAVRVSVRDLASFLINPVESTLRWHHGIRDEEEEEDLILAEDEPFYSAYPYDRMIILDSLHAYVRAGGDIDLRKFMDDYYVHASLMSATPDGAFSRVDRDEIKARIMERVGPAGGLAGFVRERKGVPLYADVAFGPGMRRSSPDVSFSSPVCEIGDKDRAREIELSGSLPFIWKNRTSGECETLVITNSARPSAISAVYPFLAYAISASGFGQGLSEFMGGGAFTIHLSHACGISPYRYRMGPREAKEYLDRILRSFLDESCFDMLPLGIIAHDRRLHPPDAKSAPDDGEKRRYRSALARLIREDADSPVPRLRSMRILEIAQAEVPADAYDKVRDRLAVLLAPFARGGPAA
jgi:exodeoxyribonuclease V gamma subunit